MNRRGRDGRILILKDVVKLSPAGEDLEFKAGEVVEAWIEEDGAVAEFHEGCGQRARFYLDLGEYALLGPEPSGSCPKRGGKPHAWVGVPESPSCVACGGLPWTVETP